MMKLQKKQIEQITNLKEKLQNNANELVFVSNVKLSKEQLSKLKELSFKKDGDSNIAFDFKKEFSRIAMPINTQVNFSAMSLDAPFMIPKIQQNIWCFLVFLEMNFCTEK